MSIQYVVGFPDLPGGERRYSIGYSELREQYHAFVRMTDAEFMAKLPSAAHFACVVCWFKEVGLDASVGDRGIVHMLIHLIEHGNTAPNEPLKEVRKLFNSLLKL